MTTLIPTFPSRLNRSLVVGKLKVPPWSLRSRPDLSVDVHDHPQLKMTPISSEIPQIAHLAHVVHPTNGAERHICP